MSGKPRLHLAFRNAIIHFLKLQLRLHHLRLRPLLLVACCLNDVETQTIRVKVDLVARVLQNLCNLPRILELPQINVRPALLDSVTDEFSGAGLTLRADNGGLLLLAGFVDNEGGALCLLLCNLLGFDSSGEFGGEGEVLQNVSISGRWNETSNLL
jgi:hypothetical protein